MNILMMVSSSGVLSYHLTRLSIRLRKEGHHVIAFSGTNEQVMGLFTSLREAGVDHFVSAHIDRMTFHDMLGTAKDIRKILEKRDVDIIHAQDTTHTLVAYLAAKSLTPETRPSIVTTVNYIPAETNLKGALYWILVSRVLNSLPEIVLPVSAYTKMRLIERGLHPSKTVVVHNAIEPDLVRDLGRKVRVNIATERKRPTVVCVGSLIPLKGQEYYLIAAKKVLENRPARFYVIGDGPRRRYLEGLASRLGIENDVVFTGGIYWPEIYHVLLNVADICVSSSLLENFPFYLLECMASGKPIVATRVGGVPEAVTDGVNGYLVPPRDPNSLADAILRLVNDQKKARQMGANGRELAAKRYSMSVLLKKLKHVYARAVRKLDVENKSVALSDY